MAVRVHLSVVGTAVVCVLAPEMVGELRRLRAQNRVLVSAALQEIGRFEDSTILPRRSDLRGHALIGFRVRIHDLLLLGHHLNLLNLIRASIGVASKHLGRAELLHVLLVVALRVAGLTGKEGVRRGGG